ncbi:MAG: hypothetical protein ABUS79_07165 [Pseudomonadota bacterium]
MATSSLATLWMVAWPVSVAHGQTPSEAGGTGGGQTTPTIAQFNKLQNEVREQRQLIVQIMQAEQQRTEMLLKLLRAQGTAAVLPDPLAPAIAAASASASDPNTTAAPATTAEGAGRALADTSSSAAARSRRGATLTGRVAMPGGGDTSDVYVFIENVKAPPVRGKTVRITQENKQFSPRVTVVQPGTSVVFPNLDTVYHNVFSNSPRNSFDLGTSRAGDTPRAVTLTRPGVVEIFCNMHQKMSANVLVVPSPFFTKARPDGSFRIDNVPLGSRKVVAWSPRAQSVEQRVDVTPAGAQVTFALRPDEGKAHLNKIGQAYGSYRD